MHATSWPGSVCHQFGFNHTDGEHKEGVMYPCVAPAGLYHKWTLRVGVSLAYLPQISAAVRNESPRNRIGKEL